MSIDINTDKLSLPIEVLELDLRTYRILKRGNVFTLSDIVNLGKNGLSRIYQLGKKQIPYILDKTDDFLQKSQGTNIAEIQSKVMPAQFESLDEFKKESISLLSLPGRTVNPLMKSGVNTIDELLQARLSNYENVRQFGVTGREEVEMALSRFSQEPRMPEDPRPLLYKSESEKPNLIKEIVPFVKALLNKLNYERQYEVLKLRYGLEDSKLYTLQEIGDYYGVSRERIRQVEKQAETNIRKAITGSFETKKWRVSQNITNEAVNLIESLQSFGDIVTESEIVDFLQKRYAFELADNEICLVRLWLVLSDLEVLPKPTANKMTSIFIEPSWESPFSKVDKNILYGVISVIYHLLLAEIKAMSKFEIVVQVNRTLKKKVDLKYLDYATKICPDIEKLNDETYQLRFESLPSIGDKAYRILYQANKPLHIRDILREINHRQVQAGAPTNSITRHLQNQLVSNSRIEPIGRSGEWSLIEWKHIAKETILELMQEFLHLKQASATAKEVYDYVHTKRESASQNSISTYLVDQKTLFTRVAEGKYGLTSWGLKSYESQRTRVNRTELDVQIDSVIKAIFADKKTDKLPLWSVVENVGQQTGRSLLTIRKRISESPYLDVELHPTHTQRKYLKYLGENQQRVVNSKTEKKVLIRQNVQSEVKNFLLHSPENSAPLAVIAAHVMKKTGCIKPTFYHYLSEIENIRKEYKGTVLVCKLIKESNLEIPLYFSQIDTLVSDNELKGNLQRAVNNLNIDNVDLGLFQLGKIFEIELRNYLMTAKAKNTFPVSNNDLERLVSMIECVGRNQVITQKHHLTLLREHRNERAHGDIPNLAERQKLMQYAPFLGDLYINYIILLNDKRQKL